MEVEILKYPFMLLDNNVEISILNWLQSIRTPIGDVIMPIITKLGDAGAIWVLLAIVLLLIPKTRKSGVMLVMALLVDLVLCNGILKNLFGRIRPFDVNDTVQLLIQRPDDFSFPSGHTAVSFTAVAALFFAGERKLGFSALVFAVLIAFSRMYLYVHYPTDILGGVIAGIIAGYIGNYIVKQLEKLKKKNGRRSG